MQNSIKRQVPSKALLSTYKRNSNLFAFFLDYSLPHQSMTKGGKEKWNSWTCLSSKRKRRIAKAIEKMICVYCICIYYYLPLYYIYSLYSTLENCKNTYGISFAIDLSRVTFFIGFNKWWIVIKIYVKWVWTWFYASRFEWIDNSRLFMILREK